jgi:hypothetical protein
MKDPDFLEEIVERVESAYEPDEIVGLLELSMMDIAQAFEKDFLDLAFNLGFIASHGDDYDKEDDDSW